MNHDACPLTKLWTQEAITKLDLTALHHQPCTPDLDPPTSTSLESEGCNCGTRLDDGVIREARTWARKQERLLPASIHVLTSRYKDVRIDGDYFEQDVPERTTPPTFLALFIKLNTLQRYRIAQNYRVLHRVVQNLSQRVLKNVIQSHY
jgi:hypothetical protein